MAADAAGQDRSAAGADEALETSGRMTTGDVTAEAVPPVGAGARRAAVAATADGTRAVARDALDGYARSWWSAIDLLLLLAVFVFCFGQPFDTEYFFTTAALPLAALSAFGTYALVHAVVPTDQRLILGRRSGPLASVAGLTLAAAISRLAACLLLALLALALGRFTSVTAGSLLAGTLGLALEGSLVAAVVVAVATPGAPRYTGMTALGVLVVGLAAFATDGALGTAVWICRLPLLPFAAAYALGLRDIPAWGWLAALTLVPASAAGLVWLAASWLGRRLAAPVAEGETLIAEDADDFTTEDTEVTQGESVTAEIAENAEGGERE